PAPGSRSAAASSRSRAHSDAPRPPPHAAAARAGQLPPPPAQFPARQGLAQAGQRGHRPPRNPRHHLPLGSPRFPPPLARAALDGAGTDFVPRPPAVRVVPDLVGRVPGPPTRSEGSVPLRPRPRAPTRARGGQGADAHPPRREEGR